MLSRGKQHIRRISTPLSLLLLLSTSASCLRDSLTNSRFIALFIVPAAVAASGGELYPTENHIRLFAVDTYTRERQSTLLAVCLSPSLSLGFIYFSVSHIYGRALALIQVHTRRQQRDAFTSVLPLVLSPHFRFPLFPASVFGCDAIFFISLALFLDY